MAFCISQPYYTHEAQVHELLRLWLKTSRKTQVHLTPLMLTRLGLYVATSRDWYKKKKKSKIFRQHTHFQPVLWRRLMSEYSTCVGVPQMLQALKSITQVNVCVGVKAAITEISRCTADTDDVSDFLLSKVKEMSPVCAFFPPTFSPILDPRINHRSPLQTDYNQLNAGEDTEKEVSEYG